MEEARKTTEIAPGVWINAAAIPTQPNPESKKSLKRKQKQAEREEQKKAWKKQRKEADKKRKLEAPATSSTANKEQTETTSPPNATEDERKNKPTRFTSKVEKREEMVNKAKQNCRILIDCDWDGVMHEKEVKSLCSQLMFSFSELKKAAQPSNILLSKCDGRIKDVLAKINGSENWVCFERYEDCLLKKNFGERVCAASSSGGPIPTLKTEVAGAGPALSADTSCTTKSPVIDDIKPNDDNGISCAAAAPAPRAAAATTPLDEVDLPFLSREKTIYLTADTDNVLTTLDPEATYIIGGVVDRNRLKQATKQRADHYGIKTARLPIAEYAESNLGSFSKVLTVNHVVMILLECQACGDWTAALEKVLPKRRKDQGYCDDTLDQDPGGTKRLKHSKVAAGPGAGRGNKKKNNAASTSEGEVSLSSGTDGDHDADHDYDEDLDDDDDERSVPASRSTSAAASPAAPRLKEQEAVPFRRRPILEKNWDFEDVGHEKSQKNEDDGEEGEEIEDTDAAWAAAIRKRGHEKSAGMDYYAEDRMDMDTARKNWSFVRTIFKKKGRFAWSGR
eukprot:g11320.t1